MARTRDGSRSRERGARLARVLGLSAVAALATATLPSRARACSCMQPPTPSVAAAQATAVFEGRTFGVSREGGRLRYSFEVSRVFKGDVGTSVHVYTASSSAACGRSFEAGVPYLVYAHSSSAGVLVDSLCSRTRQSAAAAEDLVELGAARTPTPPGAPVERGPAVEPPRIEPTPPPTTPGPRGCALGEPRPLTLALLVLFAMRSRRSRPPESRP